MYAQLVFSVLVASIALLEAVARSGIAWWIVYVLAATAGMYTHIYMALTLAAHGIWILLFERRRVVPFTLAGIIVVVAFAPMLSFLLGAQAAASRDLPVGSIGFSWGALPYTLYTFAAGFSLGPSVRELKTAGMTSALREHVVVIAAVALAFAAAAGAALAPLSRRRADLVLCVLAIAIPVLGPIAMSMFPWMIFNVRYTSGAFPFFCMLVGAGLSFLLIRSQATGWLLTGAIALLSLLSLNNHYSDSRYAKEDIRGAVAMWRHDGGTTHLASNLPPAVERYLTPDELARHTQLRDSRTLVEVLQRVLSEHAPEQVWVIISRDFDGTQQAAIRRAFRVEDERTLPGVAMFRLSRSLEADANAPDLRKRIFRVAPPP
jgi:uncharacterized membrane protein